MSTSIAEETAASSRSSNEPQTPSINSNSSKKINLSRKKRGLNNSISIANKTVLNVSIDLDLKIDAKRKSDEPTNNCEKQTTDQSIGSLNGDYKT